MSHNLLSFFFFMLSISSWNRSSYFTRPRVRHFSSRRGNKGIEVIKFRATQSPRLISHVRRSDVFQLLPIGSRYYTGVTITGGRLSLNRLRNDVKSLHRGERTHTHGTDEKNARRIKRGIDAGLIPAVTLVRRRASINLDLVPCRDGNATHVYLRRSISNSLRPHSRRFNARYIVSTCYSVTWISVRYTAMINTVHM